MNKSDKISFIANFVLVGFILAVFFHSYCYYVLHCDLLTVEKHFLWYDFSIPVNNTRDFMPYDEPGIWINYFPLAYIILYPFALIQNKFLSFLSYISIFLSFFIFNNIKHFYCQELDKFINIKNIFVMSFLSYPLMELMISCNLDMLLIVLFTVAINLFAKEKYMASALLWGIINACKPFPIMFLILFLLKKKYKEFFFSLFLSFLLVMGGFFVLKGGFIHNLTTLIISLKMTEQYYVYSPNGGMVGMSSLFMGLKNLLCFGYNIISTHLLASICKYLAVLISGITIFAVWKEKIFWKQILLLTLNMLIVPFIIADYKLIFLFVPIWLFVNTKEKSKFDLLYSILFGFLLIPKKYLPFGIFSQIHFSTTINPLIMLLFMGLIIYEQFKTKHVKESEDEQI